MITHFPFLVFVCSLMSCFSCCNCRLPMERMVLLCLFLPPSFSRPSRCFFGIRDWAVAGEQGDQTKKTLTCHPKKRNNFPLSWLTETLTEPVSGQSPGLIKGRTGAGRSWRKATAASLLLQSQQWICWSAELHSVVGLINSWSNPLLPGFWHIFVFRGASHHFAKSTALHNDLPIPDRKIIPSMLSWGR